MAYSSGTKIAIVIALVVIAAAALAGFAFTQRKEVDNSNTVIINMTSKQWEYIPSKISVKEGQTVILRIKSTDVPHGFVIEEYRVNAFLPPGEVVEVKFTADKVGEFVYFCNVFCGTGHPNHKGKLIVEK